MKMTRQCRLLTPSGVRGDAAIRLESLRGRSRRARSSHLGLSPDGRTALSVGAGGDLSAKLWDLTGAETTRDCEKLSRIHGGRSW
jgi:hypothetical protein